MKLLKKREREEVERMKLWEKEQNDKIQVQELRLIEYQKWMMERERQWDQAFFKGSTSKKKEIKDVYKPFTF